MNYDEYLSFHIYYIMIHNDEYDEHNGNLW